MKIFRTGFASIAFTTAVVFVAHCPALAATPELSGIFILNAQQRFMLADPDTKESSGWIRIGEEFEGYTLARFDAAKDTLVLKHGDAEIDVPLRASNIMDAAIAFSGKIQLGAAGSVDLQKATLNFGQETTFPLAEGITLTLKATRRKDGTIAYSSRFERTRADGEKEIFAGPNVIARPGTPISVTAGDFSYALQP